MYFNCSIQSAPHKNLHNDNNVATEILLPGSRSIDGKVKVIQTEIESDKATPDDLRTSSILLEIGNSISPFICLTSDFPSQHPSNFRPILDLHSAQ